MAVISNDTKEFCIKQVEKYNEISSLRNRTINLSLTIIGLVAIYTVFILATGNKLSLPLIFLHIAMSSSLVVGLTLLISSILIKVGMKIKIEEIKDLLAFHGLILEDEVSKSKGK